MSGITRPRAAAAVDVPAHSFTANLKRAVASMLLRREDECHPQPGVNLCEKPGMASSTMTWVIVGSVLGVVVVAILTVLLILHFRRRKHDRREDLEDRFQSSDYGLDELPGARKPRVVDSPSPGIKSQDGSPNPYGRRSRDPLHAGTEPKYQPGAGQLNGHLNPFDDASSFRSGNGSSYPPSVNPAWPKRESSQKPPGGDS